MMPNRAQCRTCKKHIIYMEFFTYCINFLQHMEHKHLLLSQLCIHPVPPEKFLLNLCHYGLSSYILLVPKIYTGPKGMYCVQQEGPDIPYRFSTGSQRFGLC